MATERSVLVVVVSCSDPRMLSPPVAWMLSSGQLCSLLNISDMHFYAEGLLTSLPLLLAVFQLLCPLLRSLRNLWLYIPCVPSIDVCLDLLMQGEIVELRY
jgi:hypothetical protein